MTATNAPDMILVLVKHAVDTATIVVDPLTGRPDPLRLGRGPEPAGLRALAWALAARESLRASGRTVPVVVLVAGSDDAIATARYCLALGADGSVRADLPTRGHDPMGTARALVMAAPPKGPATLVLAAARSEDRGSGVVPPAFAELAGIAYARDAVLDLPGVALGEGGVTYTAFDATGRRLECRARYPVLLAVRASPVPVPAVSLERRLETQSALVPVVRVSGVAHRDEPPAICPPRRAPHLRPAPAGSDPDDRVTSLMSGGVARRSGRVVRGDRGTLVEAAMAVLISGGFLTSATDADADADADADGARR